MKKKGYAIIAAIIVLMLSVGVCYAGSVPEDLLSADQAKLYFAKIMEYDGDTDTALVTPSKKIKGDVDIGAVWTIENCVPVGIAGGTPKKGETYLIGYYDEINPNYIFKTTSQDLPTLKIENIQAADMFERLQKYINDGSYTDRENERAKGASAYAQGDMNRPPAFWFLYTKAAFWISLTGIFLYIVFSIIKRKWAKTAQIVLGCIAALYGLIAAGGAKHYFLYRLYEKLGDSSVDHVKEFITWAAAEYSKDILILGSAAVLLFVIGAVLVKNPKISRRFIGVYVVLSFIGINIAGIYLSFQSINKLFDVAAHITSYAYFAAMWLFGLLAMNNIVWLKDLKREQIKKTEGLQ